MNTGGNTKSVIDRPEGVDKFINTTFEICTHKNSGWVKEGTGGDSGTPSQYMHTSKTMFVEPISRLYLGKGKGYMPTQWVIGASTHYVDDYWEDKDGKPVFDKLTPDQGKEKKYTFRPGLLSIYGKDGLKQEYEKSMQKGLSFEKGLLELKRFGDDPVLLRFINEHEQNKYAPNAAENKDPSRLKLFMFQPLIRENKAAKQKIVEGFDDKSDAYALVGKLRSKKTGGGYQYNEPAMDAILFILQDGQNLNDNDVIQKFEVIARAADSDPKTFLEIVNGGMDEYRTEIGKAETFEVLNYEGFEATVVKDGKKESVYTFKDGTSKEDMVEELVTYFLSSKIGRVEYKEVKRQSEMAKIRAAQKNS